MKKSFPNQLAWAGEGTTRETRREFCEKAAKQRLIEIGRFFSPPDTCSTGWRCDLHPRFDRSGTRVIIDSMHENDERQIYVIDVASVVAG